MHSEADLCGDVLIFATIIIVCLLNSNSLLEINFDVLLYSSINIGWFRYENFGKNLSRLIRNLEYKSDT